MALHNSLEHFYNRFIYLAQIGCADNVEKFEPIYCLRDMHVVHYVNTGKGYLDVGGHRYQVKQGDLFYIPPNCPATYGTYEEDPWEAYYFAFGGGYADELVKSSIFKNHEFVGTIEDGSKLVKIIINASDEIKTHVYPQLYGLEQLFRLLPFIMQIKKTNTISTKEKYLILCKEYIETHYNEDIQISDVAKSVNLSVNYIYRLFKDVMQTSPHDYLTSVRMQHAKKYLIETDISTRELALHLGYANYTTFYSMFNKRMHMSPHEYRLFHMNKQEKVESNCATTIRMFASIEDCQLLEYMQVKELSVTDDIHYDSGKVVASYLRRLKYNHEEYDLFAYVYEHQEDARGYFQNVAETITRFEEFEFKIKHTSDLTTLVVKDGNCVYKLSGRELSGFNEFRHVLNQVFQKILIN